MTRYQDRPLLTIVIPVYNVEKYVEKCVKSVIPKEISYEIILVDDGSTDSSLDRCKKLEESNDKIKVIHKKNGGLSSARNCGLYAAKGKYITFMDSDDWIEMGAYDMLLTEIKKDVDILKYSYVIECDEGIIEIHNILEEGIYDREQIEKNVLPLAFGGNKMSNSTIQKINLSATSSVYRLDFLKENELEFVSEREVGSEDFLFNIEALICSKKIQVIDKCFYHYVQRMGSLTQKYRINLHSQYNKLCKKIYTYMDNQNVLDKYYDSYINFYNALMYICILNECSEFAPGDRMTKIDKVKNILRESELQNNIRSLKPIDLKNFILKQLIILKAARILYKLKSR